MTSLVAARRVAVLAAMVPELEPIVRVLALDAAPLGATRAYAGSSGSHEVVAAVTSIGTRAATDVTTRLLDAYEVDHVVVVGICGGIDRRLQIGDLIVPEVVLDEASGERFHPVPLRGIEPDGILMTTDILHNDPAEMPAFVARGIVAVDMETAAIGAVSEARGIPWSVFRSISDWAGDPDVDAAVVGMSNPDGTPNLLAVLRFVLTRPWRIPKLARLGAGMRQAVQSSTAPALAALTEDPAATSASASAEPRRSDQDLMDPMESMRGEDAVVVPIEDVLDLHPFAPADIPAVVESYLEAAVEAGIVEVRLIHGRGIGVQRTRVQSVLERSPLVISFNDAPPELGGFGATIARLRAIEPRDA